ncbi:RecX family transcriptional regulator [Falsiroseomonas tokyonensis]|uniref:Regulatory protein RecX n=1 Tax=Falsiroseomonas tokyonensis TaxID=430521 RepID=A0ABV7C3M2_9PROT|nr:RecX family transcriptional regulator [Falsiroseomonas tokyonensis]MBU8540764.1 RecX family transcriptional regulator [Falsiroseomonas tokyonensis]
MRQHPRPAHGAPRRPARDPDAPPRPPGPPPGEARLREAAVAHLARHAATEAGLRRVLQRRVDRWARAAEAFGMTEIAPLVAAAKQAAALVARQMAATGTVDDAAFAESRARRLLRSGRSRRATLAHLAQKGVAAETAAAALPEGEAAEIDAALALCRRRRLGPFGEAEAPPEARLKALATLARAGFARGTAETALRMDPDEAEDRLLAFKRG